MTPWVGIPDDYERYAGFVYRITNLLTGKMYIGRKYFFFKRRKGLTESDWETYTSSSKDVNADIDKYGISNFEFLVLYLGETKTDVNYMEVHLQINADVLNAQNDKGEYLYYNKNILSKYFQPKEIGTLEHKQKCENISKALKALHSNPEHRHPMLGKVHPNRGKKLPQTGHQKNRGKVWYTNGVYNILLTSQQEVPEGFTRGLSARKKRLSRWTPAKLAYLQNPKLCLYCNTPIPWEKHKNACCNRKCADKLHSDRCKELYANGESTLSIINNKESN